MNRIVYAFLAALILTPVWAVENVSSPTCPYQTKQPTNDQVPNWTTGWGGSEITGWNYVGQVNSASGVYLGNGWVLTAAHVGIGNFVLDGNTYIAVPGSAQSISNADGTADLCLFQIYTLSSNNGTLLNLPPLVLATSDPVAFAYGTPGTSVVLIGYGGGQGETWGYNTITQINQAVTPDGYSYVSNDFLTVTGTTTDGGQSITNNAMLVLYDSGGGDFTYNTATSQWNLAGINEVTGTDEDTGQDLSGFEQLDTYAAQINGIITPPTDTPTMPLPGLFVMGCLFFLAASRALGMRVGNWQPVGAKMG